MFEDLMPKTLNAIRALFLRRVSMESDRIPCESTHVPLRKILNWIMVEASVYFKPQRPWGLPTHLQVEPSAQCNLKCAFCPVTTGLDRPTGQMAFETFTKAIDQMGDYLFLILLWDWGEPFLNPRVYDMISYAKQRRIKVVSSTNGHVFAQKDHAERLVRSGIDTLVLAVDGISQETYERYRGNGNLKTVLTAIERILAAKRALNSRTPLLNLRFLPMKHNEHEIPLLRDFARSLGVDALTLKTLNPYEQGECHSTKASGTEFVPQNPQYQRFEYDETGFRIRLERNPCKRPWNNPVLRWDGKISPCSFDPHNHYVMGDLMRQSFREIWFGDAFSQLRRQFRQDYRQIGLCAGCSYAFKGGCCGNETIAEAHYFKVPE